MKYESEPSRKRWIKRCLWKAPEWNSGDVYSSEREHERWLGRKVRGQNTHWGEEARGGGAGLQTLSPPRLWNPELPFKMCARVNLGHARCACAEPRGLTWPAPLSQVRTSSLVSTSTKSTETTSGSSWKSVLPMWNRCSIRSNKRGMGRITETHKHGCVRAEEPDRQQLKNSFFLGHLPGICCTLYLYFC